MLRCDFCQKGGQCSDAQRSECFTRDYLYFQPKFSRLYDLNEIVNLILQYGWCTDPEGLAAYLVLNGIGRR